MSAARSVATVLLVAGLGAGVLGGCSHEFGPGESPAVGSDGPDAPSGSTEDLTADAARTKLALQVQDACYAGDPRQAWTRCGRWVEETASSARTAAGALPNDAAVTTGAQEVAAGHDAFLSRGCGSPAGTTPDVAATGPCVGALGQARDGVRDLARALHVPGV